MKELTVQQLDTARQRACEGLTRNLTGDTFTITMYADDFRCEAADMYLTCVKRDTVAGYRRHYYSGDQAQVDSYIQAVIGTLL